MPYINEHARKRYDATIDKIVEEMLLSKGVDERDVAGELNYVISSITVRYIRKVGERYFRWNFLIGVLDCAKMELYRRFVGEYENQAILKNGDI
jgi:hypothetical protein